MSRGWTYVSGDWNLVCDSCSKKIKASKSKQRWDGFIVCQGCWEPRHSLDFIRARNDKITVPFTRPQETHFLTTDTSYIVLYVDDGYFESIGFNSFKQTYIYESDQ